MWRPPGAATVAGGTHPTGMHSCFLGGGGVVTVSVHSQ